MKKLIMEVITVVALIPLAFAHVVVTIPQRTAEFISNTGKWLLKKIEAVADVVLDRLRR